MSTTPPTDPADLDPEACRALWCALIERLLRDAILGGADAKAAINWLERPDPLVLELAGLDPDAARPVLAQRAAEARSRAALRPPDYPVSTPRVAALADTPRCPWVPDWSRRN